MRMNLLKYTLMLIKSSPECLLSLRFNHITGNCWYTLISLVNQSLGREILNRVTMIRVTDSRLSPFQYIKLINIK